MKSPFPAYESAWAEIRYVSPDSCYMPMADRNA